MAIIFLILWIRELRLGEVSDGDHRLKPCLADSIKIQDILGKYINTELHLKITYTTAVMANCDRTGFPEIFLKHITIFISSKIKKPLLVKSIIWCAIKKKQCQASWCTPIVPVPWRQRQENYEFKARPGSIERPFVKTENEREREKKHTQHSETNMKARKGWR